MAITCNCAEGGKCEIHPKYPAAVVNLKNTAADVVPQLDPADKLTLKTLEAEFLKAQIESERARQSAVQRQTMAYQQLEQFSAVMYEKAGLKQSEYQLDLARLEFVKRPEPPKA